MTVSLIRSHRLSWVFCPDFFVVLHRILYMHAPLSSNYQATPRSSSSSMVTSLYCKSRKHVNRTVNKQQVFIQATSSASSFQSSGHSFEIDPQFLMMATVLLCKSSSASGQLCSSCQTASSLVCALCTSKPCCWNQLEISSQQWPLSALMVLPWQSSTGRSTI